MKKKIKVFVFPNKKIASKYLANKIYENLFNNPDLNIGLASGVTFVDIYKNLSLLNERKPINWNNINTYNLDEFLYEGTPPKHACYTFMSDLLFDNVHIPKNNVHFPPHSINVSNKDLKDYDNEILNKNIQFQLLGLGKNGHIGYNEPPNLLKESVSRTLNLTESTIIQKSNYFYNGNKSLIHPQVSTVGIQTILKLKSLILICFDKTKSEALSNLICKTNTNPNFPVSYLGKSSNIIVITDEECINNLPNNILDNVAIVFKYKN